MEGEGKDATEIAKELKIGRASVYRVLETKKRLRIKIFKIMKMKDKIA